MAEWALLILIIISSGLRSVATDGPLTELKESQNGLVAAVRNHHNDIAYLFSSHSVNTVNFIINRGESEESHQAWIRIYEEMVLNFADKYSFVLLTDEFFNYNRSFLSKFVQREYEVEREGFVVSLDFHENEDFEAFLLRDNAFYLVVVDNENVTTMDEVLQNVQKAWQKTGSLTIIVIYKNNLWTFNPFGRQGNNTAGTYGVLDIYKRTNLPLRKQLLRDLNGYPLVVEFFESGYNIAFYKEDKSRSYLKQFLGPDGVTVEILQKQMNFTGKFFKIYVAILSVN